MSEWCYKGVATGLCCSGCYMSIHVFALCSLVDERALSGLENARVEDRVYDLVRKRGETLRVLREGEILRDAGEHAVGLDYEELGDDGGELM